MNQSSSYLFSDSLLVRYDDICGRMNSVLVWVNYYY